jgi:hypothetical protein
MKKNTIKMPTGWSEVTIDRFQLLEDFDTNDVENVVGLISKLSGMTVEEIESADIDELNWVVEGLHWVGKLPSEAEFKREVRVDGKTYAMPSDFNRYLSFGNWMDLTAWLEDDAKKNIHNIMAVVYRPKLRWYEFWKRKDKESIEDFEKRAEVFRKGMTVGQAYPCLLFFYNFANNFYLSTQAFSGR